MIKKILFLLIILTTCIKGFSQDDPCTAIQLPLSVIGSCNYIVGDNIGATDSDLTNPNIDAPAGCDPVSANYSGADVWFYVDLGPTTTSIQIDLTHIGTSNFDDGVAALYTGTCGGTLTIVECDDDSGSGLLEANFSIVNGLTPSTRVFIRAWNWGGIDQGTFNICASEVEDPCNSITNIPVCGTTPINTTIASGFGAFNDSSCIDVPGDEAAFSFTPTLTGYYTITQISTFDHINYLYQTSCAVTGWTCIDDLFGNNETTVSFNMIAGTTYYIMLDSENSNGGNVSFSLNCPPTPPECGDPFYDSGGIGGNYSNNELETTTIFPDTPGDAVTVTFSAFDLESCCDDLNVYDGPDATYPLIGTFSGAGTPGPFTSSDASGALTFVFISDSSVTDPGWEAIVSCAPYVAPTVCGSIFTDSGGVGGNYSSGENTTTILIPDIPGTAITATFTFFETENTYDFLYIYDGPNDTFPLIGIPYTGLNSPGTVTSSHPSGALTFVFESDFSNTDGGWAADITCISNCNLIITDINYPIGADQCNLDYIELTTNAITTLTPINVYSEPFNAATFPAGWNLFNGAASADWMVSNSNNAGGTANEAHLDWTIGRDVSSWSISSPAIDITGQTNLQLSFRHYLNVFGTETTISIRVQTSLDGTTWTNQYSVINAPGNINPTTQNIDISSLDGNTTMYIRYRLSGDTFDFFDWFIDDIFITADGSPTLPLITWSPTTGLYTDIALTIPYAGGFAETVYAAPNGTQTYTATDSNSCTDTEDVTYNKKVWNGSVDTNWYNDNNWKPNGVPNSTNCVVIPDPTQSNGNSPVSDIINLIPLPPQPALANNLTIQNNGYLEIEANTSIEVVDFVNIAPNGTLLLRDSASLIQITEGAANTNNNTGAINMQRLVNDLNTYDYVYWSSPVENFNVEQISPNTNANAIWKWLPTQAVGGGIGNHGDWRNATTNEAMIVGQGYIVKDLGGATVTPPALPANTTEFIGRPNNGILTYSISRGTHTTAAGNYTGESGILNATTPQDDNWNLVGNPYPSAISYGDFINANSTIDGTIHLWTHQFAPTAIPSPFYEDFGFNYSDDYIDNNYSGSNPPGFNGNIAAGQSFFVQMLEITTSTTEDLIFNNGMRSPSNDNSQFYRQASSASQKNNTTIERHRIWLDLLTSENIATSTLVGYIEGATNQKDRLYDGYDFEGVSISFYSLIAEEKMAIQGRALPFLDSDTVPMGLTLQQSGMFTIAINTIDGLFATTNQAIYIEDTYSNTIHNLRTMPYTFTSESGTFNDRFILKYRDSALGIDEFKALNLNITAPNGDYIKITSDNNPIKSIQVYDLLGRVLLDKTNVNNTELIIENNNLSEGTYIVKATLGNNKFRIQKIILSQ
jgi:hypothetical protein